MFVDDKETLLRASFSGDWYDKMKRYFTNIWSSDAKYKVFMARRAFNLNYAFMQACGANQNKQYDLEGIISNTALLFSADIIAFEYYDKKEFSKILIADDLMMHGRGIQRLLWNLEELIIDYLLKKRYLFDRRDLHRKFLEAVEIYVFAQNQDSKMILLDRGYHAEQKLPMEDLRSLSQEISNSLQVCGIANTSYVLSVELSEDEYRSLQEKDRGDNKKLFQYRGNTQLYFYKVGSNPKLEKKLLETVRINRSRKDISESKCINSLTSLVIFGNLGTEDFDLICDRVSQKLSELSIYMQMSVLLKKRDPQLRKPRAQLLSFLLSVVCYITFFEQEFLEDKTQIYKRLLRSDYQKVGTNFDIGQNIFREIRGLFLKLCTDPMYYLSFRSTLYGLIKMYAKNLEGLETLKESYIFQQQHLEEGNGELRPYEAAENLFYEIGINAEYDAKQYAASTKVFRPDKQGSDTITFNHYLEVMNRKKIDGNTGVGCLLGLMDSGLLSMNVECFEEEQEVQCILKAGELSTFVLPRRFSDFVPALAMVEKQYQKKSDDRKRAMSFFINYLQKRCSDELDQRYLTEQDQDTLAQLQKEKGNLLYMYNVGQRFQDWDIDLLTTGDRIEKYGKELYKYYQLTEDQKKQYYQKCAKEYLSREELY